MGNHMSTKTTETTSTSINFATHQFTTELDSYKTECRLDHDTQSFDTVLQARTNQAIKTVAGGVEVRAVNFDAFMEVTGCLMEMNQEVVKVLLDCKEDIWKNTELFELVEEYFHNSLKTLDFCTALERCIRRARDSQLFLHVALQMFDEESDNDNTRYVRTLAELKKFKDADDPFTGELIQIYESVYSHQKSMLENLQLKKKSLDRKLRHYQAWRKVSGIIFAATLAAVLICSVVAAAVAAPPVAAALAAASAVPIGSMGGWIDSMWKNYENAVKGQKDVVVSMEMGTRIAIKDLDNIRALIDRSVIEIDSLLKSADIAMEEEGVKIGIKEIKKQVGDFMMNVEVLAAQADKCSKDVSRARTAVLNRIIRS